MAREFAEDKAHVAVKERCKNPKILVVHSALTPGGATRVAIDDARSLQKQGFAVGFATDRGVLELEKELRASHIQRHRLYFVDPGRYPKWIRYLMGVPVSTILLLRHVLWNYYNCLYVLHRQSSIPSTVVSWLTGVPYVFIAVSEMGKYNKGRLFTPLGRHVIAVSEQVKRNIVTNFQMPAHRVTVIPNATKTDVVRADDPSLHVFDEQWSIRRDQPVVACVAMLVEIKAHEVLLSAWEMVMRRCPQAVLILTGDGPLKGQLQTQCREIGIEQGVRFLGFVDDLSVVYSRASFVVLSSRSEGLPTSILEAFAYGLPAIATAVGGTPEIVLPEQTGLLVGPDNPEELAQAIVRLLGDPCLRHRLGEAARQLVVEKFSAKMREVALGDYFGALERA